MNKLDTSFCTPTNVMFLKSGTFDFMQLGYANITAYLVRSWIGDSYDPTKVYLLGGLNLTSGGGTDSYSPGYIFYNDEVFIKPSTTSFPTGTAVLNLSETSYTVNADPTDFSLIAPQNVHIERTVSIVAGASGTGTLTNDANSDFDNLIPVQPVFTDTGISLVSGWGNFGSPYYDVAFAIDGVMAHLSGAVTKASIASGTVNVLSLPTAAKPSEEVEFNVWGIMSGVSADRMAIAVQITTTGLLRIVGATAGSCTLFFDSVSYRLR